MLGKFFFWRSLFNCPRVENVDCLAFAEDLLIRWSLEEVNMKYVHYINAIIIADFYSASIVIQIIVLQHRWHI